MSGRHFVKKILRALDQNIARVDMSGKSGAHRHHRKNYKPAPKKNGAGFFVCAARFAELVSILRILLGEFSVKI
jgi:hypothetical protein